MAMGRLASFDGTNGRKLIRGGENCFQVLNCISGLLGRSMVGCNGICMIAFSVYSSSCYIIHLRNYDPRYVVYEYRESSSGR
jgi:hypothetical protein